MRARACPIDTPKKKGGANCSSGKRRCIGAHINTVHERFRDTRSNRAKSNLGDKTLSNAKIGVREKTPVVSQKRTATATRKLMKKELI